MSHRNPLRFSREQLISKNVFGEIVVVPKNDGKNQKRLIQHRCKKCGAVRWISVYLVRKSGFTDLCMKCARKLGYRHPQPKGSEAHAWRGGRCAVGKERYVLVYMSRNDPYYSMGVDRGKLSPARYVLEHRIVMARHIGRALLPGEVVHHINGNKQDNRIENLELLPNKAEHLPYNQQQQTIKRLKAIIEELKIDNNNLKMKIEQMEREDLVAGGVENGEHCPEGSDV